jgi:hypothetical protein
MLPGMVSPEQLARRVDRTEDDCRAISDTVVDIKETVDSHTEELAAIRTTLAEHGQQLTALETRVTQGFAEILRRLDNR